MKYCPICQKEYPDESGFCGVCGVKLEPVEASKANSEVNREAMQQTCNRCGNPLNPNMAFCPVCGTPVGNSAPVQSAPNFGGAPINGGYMPSQPVAPKNDAFSKGMREFVSVLKDFFVNPDKAIKDVFKSTSPLPGVFSAAITVIAFLIFALCLCGKFSMEFYADDDIFGSGILIGAFGGVLSIAVPMVVSFVAAKLAKKDVAFLAVASLHAVAMLPVAAILIIAGVSSLISLQLAMFWIFVAVTVKFVLSVSLSNRVSGGLFASSKTLWGTVGVTAVLKAIELALLFFFTKSAAEDLIANMFWSLF